MRIGSLFSGYGGLDIAVQSVLGGDLAWYSEIEPAACKVLAAHHPGVPNLGDITAVDWGEVEPVDILTGGYPCQPFSHAGNRKGKNDERHLWPFIADALRQGVLRPGGIAVFENVDGHRSLGLADVMHDLAALGFAARWGVVRAADAGAPHGRKRVFIVAYPEGGRWGTGQGSAEAAAGRVIAGVSDSSRSAADAVSERHNGTGAAGTTQGQVGGRADAAGSSDVAADAGSAGSQGSRHAEPQRITFTSDGAAADADLASGEARGTSARGASGESTAGQREPVGSHAATRRGVTADADRDGYGGGTHSRGVGSLEAGDEGEACERERPRSESGAGVAWGKYAAAIDRWERLTRPAPAPTVPGKNGRPRLSPHFVEWMMGLPAGHVTGHDLSAAQELKMLGNGVVPQQAALALRLLGVGA